MQPLLSVCWFLAAFFEALRLSAERKIGECLTGRQGAIYIVYSALLFPPQKYEKRCCDVFVDSISYLYMCIAIFIDFWL